VEIFSAGKKHNRKLSGARACVALPPARLIRPADVLKVLFVAVLVAAGAWGALSTPKVVKKISSQRVERVLIEGDVNYVSEQEVLAAVNSFISESLLLVDMEEIKKELEHRPWIRNVSIRREWPDTLVLKVTEEKAIARWGEKRLLNQDGEIFLPDNIIGLEQLAILTGPDDSARKIMEQYQLFNQLLYQRGLKIAELSLSDRGAWRLIFSNGVRVNIGKSDVMAKMRRLVGFLDPFFMERIVSVESIDLRYTSGIAVKNKSITGEKVVSL
jgi:cell division protein FtsQ